MLSKMNELSRLHMCRIVLGCKSSDPFNVRQFIQNIGKFIETARVDEFYFFSCLRCFISILASKEYEEELRGDAAFVANVNKLFDLVVESIRGSAATVDRKELLELSLVALNLAHRQSMLSADTSINVFQTLLSWVRVCVENKDNGASLIHLAAVTVLGLIQNPPTSTLENADNLIEAVKELVQFCSNEESTCLEPKIKEDMMRLAIGLLKLVEGKDKSSDESMDKFLVNWSIKNLSGQESNNSSAYSTLCLHLSIRYVNLLFKVRSTSKTIRKRIHQSDEKKAKLINKILTSGVMTNFIWLLLHPNNDISTLSERVLRKLIGQRGDKAKNDYSISLKDPGTVRLLLQQSLVPAMLCMKNNKVEPARSQLLKNIISDLQSTVIAHGIEEFIDTTIPEASILSCTGLLLIAMMPAVEQREPEFCKDFLKSLVDFVLGTVFGQPNLEEGMVFWKAIEFIVNSTSRPDDVEKKNNDTAMLQDEHLLSGDDPVVILYGSSTDDSDELVRMECPSIVQLRRLVSKLANHIECQGHEPLPIIRGTAPYDVLEKLVNDASCYEPQTRQELLDEMCFTGEDVLSIDKCLELLYLAHTYAAKEIKQRYSMLCEIKLEPECSIKVLETAVKSEDHELAKSAFRLACENMNDLINGKEKDVSELLSKIIVAWLELPL